MSGIQPAQEARRQPASGASTGLRRGLACVVLLYFGTRLVVWTAAYYGASELVCHRFGWKPPLADHREALVELAAHPERPEYGIAAGYLLNLAPLLQFDGLNYKAVLETGYRYEPPPADAPPYQHAQNIAFFPLYPLLTHPLALLVGSDVALVLVAHVCSLLAAVALFCWLRTRLDDRGALLAAAALFCFPAACFYSFGYAESLTLLFLVLALWQMDAARWWPAGVACAMATATRPTAAAIVPVLMLAYWIRSGAPPRRKLPTTLALGLLGSAGLLAYGGYLALRFGSISIYWENFEAGWVPHGERADWIEFATLAPVWSRLNRFIPVLAGFPVGLVELASPVVWTMPLGVFVLAVSIAGWRRADPRFRPLLLLGPLIFLHAYIASGGASFGLDPIARYMATAVPAFAVLAAWIRRRPFVGGALLAAMLLLQAAWAFRFGLRTWSG